MVSRHSLKREKKTFKYSDESSTDERDVKGYFNIQTYFRTLDIIIELLENRFNGLNQIVNIDNTGHCMSNGRNQFKHSTISSVNNYGWSNYSTKMVFWKNQISKLNSVRDLTECTFVDKYLIVANFPDLCTACYLLLTVPVTVGNTERSFSKPKIINNCFRCTMSKFVCHV